MPYVYAIRERIDRSEDAPWQEIFHPVSEDVAEQHPDGVVRLMTIHGTPASIWYPMSMHQMEEKDYGKGKPLTDCLGVPLAAHDYVTGAKTGYVQHHVAEVVNFTPQKIRIRYIGGFTALKSPNELTKVDKALFG